jgi:hypothetical protein
MSSEACLSKKINLFHVREPPSVQKASSVTDVKFSENAQKAVVEN